MMFKRILFILLGLFMWLPLHAQDNYVIIATKGSSGLFEKPAGVEFQKGDVLLAKRKVNGQTVDVAQVKIALLDDRYFGVKIEKPLSGARLRKGDFLVAQSASSFTETLAYLDQFESTGQAAGSRAARDPIAPPRKAAPVNSSDDAIRDLGSTDSLNNFAEQFSVDLPIQSPNNASNTRSHAGGTPQPVQTVSPTNNSGSFLGFSLVAMAAISNTADRYASAAGFGLQAVTDIGLRSNLRWSVQHTLLKPSTALQNSLNAAGHTLSSGLTLASVSIQPRIMNNVVLDLGVGYYRLSEERNTGTRTTTSTKNAIGTLTGIGYHWRLSRVSSLMLLGSGNFYFLDGDNAAFFSFLAGYFFSI